MRWTSAVWIALSGAWVSGCMVPAKQAEDARAALRDEQAAHRVTADRAYTLARELDDAKREIKRREGRVDEGLASVAEHRFEYDVAVRQREEAEAVVEQLRGELARTGEHLHAYAGERERLAQELKVAERRAEQAGDAARARGEELLLMRDVSLTFHPEISAGRAKVAPAVDDAARVVLTFSAQEMLGESGVSVEGAERLQRVATIATRDPERPVIVSVAEVGGGAAPESALLRLSQLAEALSAAGLSAERVVVSVDAEGSGETEPSVVLTLLMSAEVP